MVEIYHDSLQTDGKSIYISANELASEPKCLQP